MADDQLQGLTDPQRAWNQAQGQSQDPSFLMGKALLNEAFPWLSPPATTSIVPNAAGKVPTQDPLDSPLPYAMGGVDAASWLSPEIFAKGGSLAALHLMPKFRRTVEGAIPGKEGIYHILNDAKEHVGDLKTFLSRPSNQLNIDWIGGPGSIEKYSPGPLFTRMQLSGDPYGYANQLGPSEIRSLIPALLKEHPEAESLTGYRVSGARNPSKEPGEGGDVFVKLKKRSE